MIDLREKKNKSEANPRTLANKEKQGEIASPPATAGGLAMTAGGDGREKPASLDYARGEPIVWEAEEFEYHHKDGTWFLSAGIIGMAFLAFAAMTRNFLMIPLIFIFAFVVYVFAVKKPRVMEFEISGDGVAMKPTEGGEGKFFPFKDFSSFWIFHRGGGRNELSFETNKLLYPHLKIPLPEEINVENLRATLANFVEEKEQEESLSEILARWLKF